MACSRRINTILRNCNVVNGGIKEVILISLDNLRVVEKEVNGIKYFDKLQYFDNTVWEDVSSVLDIQSWGIYSFQRNTANVQSTLTNENANGAVYVENTLTLNFKGTTDDVREEVENLVNNYFAVFYKDMNNKWFILNDEDGQPLVTATLQTGSQISEGNFFTLTCEFDNSHFPLQIQDSMYLNLIKSMEGLKNQIGYVDVNFTDGSVSTLEYPNGVIPKDAFLNQTTITSVTFHNGTRYVGEDAFMGCTNISELTFYSIYGIDFYVDAFADLNAKNGTVYVPKGCLAKYKNLRTDLPNWTFTENA